VAGTGGPKPYLFNADNVARYAPAAWHSAGSAVDASYATLDAVARRPQPVPVRPADGGVDEPPRSSRLPPAAAPCAAEVAGRDVWLIHPWALGEPPADLPAGCLRLGWWPAEHHAAWPWSAARWGFVGARLSALAALRWHGSRRQLTQALAAARSVQTAANPHVAGLLPPVVRQRASPRLFAQVDRPCASFSAWWKLATREVESLGDLPGLGSPVSPAPGAMAPRSREPAGAPLADTCTRSNTEGNP
jgi:deoxyribodipyrimidine photo-lyase